LLLDLVLAFAAVFGEHALRPAPDVEHAELVLQVYGDPLQEIEIADLALLVAVLHHERPGVPGDQRLVHVEERADAGTRADDGGLGHARNRRAGKPGGRSPRAAAASARGSR